MNKEQLIAKGVSRKFDGQQVWFEVASLKEHYEGIQFHESDLDDSGFLKAADIFGDDIREIEVAETPNPTIEVVVTQEALDENPQLVAEGIEVGEILTVDAEEVVVDELPVLDETPDSEE